MARFLYRSVLVVALACFAYPAAAQDRHEGNWWLEMRNAAGKAGEPALTAYALGILEGQLMVAHLLAPDPLAESVKDGSMTPAVKTLISSWDTYVRNVTPPQLCDGLNAFYDDFRNRRIRVTEAAWIVLNSIAGTPKSKIEEMTEQARRQAASQK